MTGVFVTVKVPPSVKEAFLQVMTEDVEGSRKEEGCVRFDLLDQGDGVYSFYEVYTSEEAMAFHRRQPHYQGWADFKKANMDTVGASQTVIKFELVGSP